MREISAKDLDKNIFDLIGNRWMLVAAKKSSGKVNAMTASWGGLGVMWGKDVCFVVIRPQRYTKEFVEDARGFSLTFYDEEYKKMLGYMGKVSGRDEDKISTSKLTVLEHDGVPYFEQANLTLICKKLFKQDFNEECFIDKTIIDQWYPQKDYHSLYIAQIEKVFVK